MAIQVPIFNNLTCPKVGSPLACTPFWRAGPPEGDITALRSNVILISDR